MIITPQTKVGEFLDAYPHLEDLLISFSPTFQKLKNPILRKTVAKVATLQQVARVGNISVDKLVNTLREEAGQDTLDISKGRPGESTEKPDWVREDRITDRFDAIPVINAGENPMAAILRRVDLLDPDRIFLFKTPFYPAPIIEKIEQKGFNIYSVQRGEGEFENFVIREPGKKS